MSCFLFAFLVSFIYTNSVRAPGIKVEFSGEKVHPFHSDQL
jgi:hypothetical protein